jgi:hypothetical protein
MDSISVIFAAILSVFGGQEPQAVNYGCETVDVGGYSNFVDPTCPPASHGSPVEVEDTDLIAEEGEGNRSDQEQG